MVCVRLIHKKNTSKDCDRREYYNNKDDHDDHDDHDHDDDDDDDDDDNIVDDNDDDDDDDDDDDGVGDESSHNTPGIFKMKRKLV